MAEHFNRKKKRNWEYTLRPAHVSKSLNEALDMLEQFFSIRTRNRLLECLTIYMLLDVATVKPDSEWPDFVKQAHKYCREFAKDFYEANLLRAMRNTIELLPPKQKLTVPETIKLGKTRLQLEMSPREEIEQMCAERGIAPEGLRKSTLIKRIIQYDCEHRKD